MSVTKVKDHYSKNSSDGSQIIHDHALNNIMKSFDGSVPDFLDVVFGFLSRHDPSSVLNSNGISLEHLLSQAVHKWRCRLSHQQQQSTIDNSDIISSLDLQQPPSVAASSTLQQSLTSQCFKDNIEPHFCQGDSAPDCAVVAEEVVVSSSEESAHNWPALNQQENGRCPASEGAPYYWTQTIEDVDIRVPVTDTIVKGRQLSVSIGSNNVKVGLTGQSEPLLAGTLHSNVDPAESIWDLAPKQHVTLHLSKREAAWWNCGDSAIVGVPGMVEGDSQPERPYSSLPADEQAHIQRIMFDAEQKALGKPTSDQMKMESTLRDAWDVEGSPFKGQHFDPSLVNVTSQQH